jgi:hypothetical protein
MKGNSMAEVPITLTGEVMRRGQFSTITINAWAGDLAIPVSLFSSYHTGTGSWTDDEIVHYALKRMSEDVLVEHE